MFQMGLILDTFYVSQKPLLLRKLYSVFSCTDFYFDLFKNIF